MKIKIKSNDFEIIENTLNDMSKKGYKYYKTGLFHNYYFKECEKDKYQYQVDYFISTSSKKFSEYRFFLKHANIKIVFIHGGFVFLEKINDGKEFILYTDYNSIKERTYRVIRLMLINLALFIILLMYNLLNKPEKEFQLFGISINVLACILMLTIQIIHIAKKFKQLKNYRKWDNYEKTNIIK